MVPPGTNLEGSKLVLGSKLVQLRSNLERLEQQLSDGRAFMLGEEPCGADFSAFHPVNALAFSPRTLALVAPHARVQAWLERVRGVGHGKPEALDVADAIAIARDATPARFAGEPVTPDGIALGTPVLVLSDEYGSGNVAGTLAPSGLHEIAVRRQTERAGEVVVHFPREDYALIATG